MYYVVNLETRAVLTYKDGKRIIEATEVRAACKAKAAQEYRRQPHAVMSIASSDVGALGREVAPGFHK